MTTTALAQNTCTITTAELCKRYGIDDNVRCLLSLMAIKFFAAVCNQEFDWPLKFLEDVEDEYGFVAEEDDETLE